MSFPEIDLDQEESTMSDHDAAVAVIPMTKDDALNFWFLIGRIVKHCKDLPPGLGEPWREDLERLQALFNHEHPQWELTKIYQRIQQTE